MNESKALFLRILAERANSPWRASIAARAGKLQQIEEMAVAQLAQQAGALKAARNFWAERVAADRAYLQRLEACSIAPEEKGASIAGALGAWFPVCNSDCNSPTARGPVNDAVALGPAHARKEKQWHVKVLDAADRAGAWSQQLPRLIESHDHAAEQIRSAIVTSVRDAEVASKLVRDSMDAVWPVGSPAEVQLPGSHSSDTGPEGICLWLAVRRYLSACGSLHGIQAAALARAQRQEARLDRLGAWVNKVLGRSTADTGGSTSSSPMDIPSPASPPSELSQEPALEKVDNDRSDDSDGEEVLDSSMDISALVIHRQHVEVKDGMDEHSIWEKSYVVLSVDLWLQIWAPGCLCDDNTEPAKSIPLPTACARPVAKLGSDDPRELKLVMRQPHAAVPSFTGLRTAASAAGLIGQFLRGRDQHGCGSVGTIDSQLRIRCESAASAREFLATLELVEKLYPVIA
jgi:hypothetical protein